MLTFYIILVIALGFYLRYKDTNESFGIPMPNAKPLMFGRMSCPYTVKMVDELKSTNNYNKFKFIDTETKEGSDLLVQYGGQGVPYFVSKNGRASGFMKTSQLFDKLNI